MVSIPLQIREYTNKFAELPTLKFLELLNKERFEAYSLKFPTELLMGTDGPGSMGLKYSPYGEMFDLDALRTDLTTLYMTVPLRKLGVSELLERYSEDELGTCFPELRKLIVLAVTLGISSCGAERSFSALKLIKTRLRSTMLTERCSNLSFMKIEADYISHVDNKDFIDMFASKGRKIDLVRKRKICDMTS